MSNTWYWPADRWHLRAYSRLMSSEALRPAIVRRNLLVERVLPSGTRNHPPEEVMEHYRGPLATPESRAGVAAFPAHILQSSFWLGELEHAVPRILRDVPLLLAWGVHDYVFSPHFMERFRRDFTRVSVQRLDAGHFLQEDAPGPLADAIDAFLTGGRTADTDGAAEPAETAAVA
jgi:haloalkane dehalogenase